MLLVEKKNPKKKQKTNKLRTKPKGKENGVEGLVTVNECVVQNKSRHFKEDDSSLEETKIRETFFCGR